MEIRAEKPNDINAVRQINISAFERETEANLVDQLRGVAGSLSLVAVESDQIVGHIFFSPVTVEGGCADDLLILGLAPIAVHPDHQRRGIGSLLIQQSLKECKLLGCKAVAVLGHPKYYPRFGFTVAKEKGLRCEFTVPDEAFMILELECGSLEGCVGMVKYRPEFDQFV